MARKKTTTSGSGNSEDKREPEIACGSKDNGNINKIIITQCQMEGKVTANPLVMN